MKKKLDHDLVLVAAWSFVLTAIVLVSQQTLRADEPEATDEAAPRRQVRIELRGSVPLLDKIPMVKTLVGTVLNPTADVACKGQGECPSECQEQAGQEQIFTFFPQAIAAWNQHECTNCPDSPCCAKAGLAQCQATASGGPCEIREDVLVIKKADCAQPGHCCQEGHSHVAQASHESCEQLAELRAEIASLHAQLAARESVSEARSELFHEMLDIMTEKARLEAQLAHADELHHSQEKMRELLAENARLKASIELAEMRHSMFKQSVEVASENERLRLRVAELEQRQSTETEARTAKKHHLEQSPQTK